MSSKYGKPRIVSAAVAATRAQAVGGFSLGAIYDEDAADRAAARIGPLGYSILHSAARHSQSSPQLSMDSLVSFRRSTQADGKRSCSKKARAMSCDPPPDRVIATVLA